MGLHRKLLDVVRIERQSLNDADLKAIESSVVAKQSLVELIHQAESERLKLVGELALQWKKPIRELTLPNLIILIQLNDLKSADQFRSTYNALTILIQRITTQNKDNRDLIELSLAHIHRMKKNVLNEKDTLSITYTQNGGKSSTAHSSRLISKKA